MLVTPSVPKQVHIPPGFIDFASSSFDAIFYQRERHPSTAADDTSDSYHDEPPQIRRRASHLPDLLPFIELITAKCNVEPVQLVMALIYVQRFRASLPPGYKAESEAAHRIFAASLLVASKYSEDRYLSTKQLVRATGDVWSIKEMTRMELALLRFLQWDLHIDTDEIATFLHELNFDASIVLSPQQPTDNDDETITSTTTTTTTSIHPPTCPDEAFRLMPFSAYLEAASIPEWRKAYMDYKGLCAALELLQKQRSKPTTKDTDELLHQTPSSHIESPISSRHSHHSRLSEAVSNELSDTFEQERAQLGEHNQLDLASFYNVVSHGTKQERLFFHKLDEQLDRIARFYNERENEIKSKLTALRIQMELVADYGRLISEEQESRELREQQDQQQEEDGGAERDAEYCSLLARCNPLRWFKRLRRCRSILTTSTTTKKPPFLANLSTLPIPLRYATKNDHFSYQVARGRLKRALTEFYRSIELLQSYKETNLQGFQSILRKFDRIAGWQANKHYMEKIKQYHWASTKDLEKVMEDTISLFANEFSRGNRAKSARCLKTLEKKQESLTATSWRVGFYLGAAVFLLLYDISLVNYKFIFELNPGDNLDYRQFAEGRIVFSYFFPVEFRDFFVADELNSLSYSFWTINYFFCAYAYDWSGLASTGTDLIWILASMINSSYTSIWDIKMDWGLLQTPSRHFLLRDDLVYYRWVYYVAAPLNVVLRFAWALNTASLTLHSDVLGYLTALLEAYRRLQWNFFRLENEHFNNCADYRAINEIPLPFATTATVDEENGTARSQEIRLPLSDEEEDETAAAQATLTDAERSAQSQPQHPPSLTAQRRSSLPIAARSPKLPRRLQHQQIQRQHTWAHTINPATPTRTGTFYGRRDFESKREGHKQQDEPSSPSESTSQQQLHHDEDDDLLE
ncbi:EXS family-domain-containing protein [Zychaea mexicana]|uniref:EXS family-domain-containing protein n=1 Tax=Zychaea mexicana TaxID=64656 RepID=UPI0022FF0072|nr:EXS family-domain-containing protein [Zychaea mexicana]KAI9499548.1 EXS family-domain-containing protein [Zychaea mexicana]